MRARDWFPGFFFDAPGRNFSLADGLVPGLDSSPGRTPLISAGRSVVSTAALLVVAWLSSTICAASIEVYPGPGGNAYLSNLYQVEVFNGSSWIPAYVYKFSRQSVCHWHYGTTPSVNFLTFGTTGAVDVRVTKIAGPITTVDVSPHSKNIPVQLSAGKAVLTLNQNNKAWITVNGDDANPLFVFADAPKPPVPAGATYVGPGVLDVPTAGNHYKASNNEVIYLDGGAWVRGNIDVRGTRNVQIMGPGVLSGDLWRGEDINPLPFNQFTNYVMITGDFYGGNGASVRGITIVDTPAYSFFGGASNVSGVKILSPWFFGTDAFQGVSHVDHSFCFNGDNVFMPMWAGVQNDNVTITSSFAGTSNNSVFAGGYWGFESSQRYSALADDIDIKTYNNDDWVPPAPLLASVFQVWLDNNVPTAGYSNQTYQNIRIEGNLAGPMLQLKNVVYPWGGPYVFDPPLGNSYNLIFKNISLEGTQKYRSEIKGWDANNGFHRVVLENVKINGTVVTPANVGSYFDINSYVWGLTYTTAGAEFFTVTPCRLADTRNPPGASGGPALSANSGRTFPVSGLCSIPSTAKAVALIVVAVAPSDSGDIRLYPAGGTAPTTSAINFRVGITRANNAVIPLGTSGQISAFCDMPAGSTGSTHLVIDAYGYLQ